MHRSRTFMIALPLLCSAVAHIPIALAQQTELPEGVVAVVNGRPIAQLSVDNVAQQLSDSGQEADPARILDELINLEILTQAAEQMELDKDQGIAASLQLQYTQTMANAYLARKSGELSFSDAELRAEYDEQSAAVDRSEFRASHILLDQESDALAVLEKLEAGADFGDLAAEFSIDPSGQDGGDLGWLHSSAMAPAFADALLTLEVGDISTAPVETEYGYHIIRLVDKRSASLPDFEAVKGGLNDLVMRKALARHVDELKAEADIQRR